MSAINRWVFTADTKGVSPTGANGMDGPTIMRKCSDLLARGSQGACSAKLQLSLAPVAAQATLTFAGNTSNADTLTVGNLIITFVTSGGTASAKHINIGVAGDGTEKPFSRRSAS